MVIGIYGMIILKINGKHVGIIGMNQTWKMRNDY